mmetsp:Transcript_18710/g.53639  ORF Transcript_18710/g.53639 Transcript_18710/m.53639 type:complete len:410 (+) Transcript_18710:499-1728(+)
MERAEATVLPDRLTKPPLSTWVLSLVGAFAAEPLDHEVSEGSNVDPHPRVLSGLVLRPRRLLHHGGNRLCAGGRIARQTPLRPKATAPKERRCANEPQGGNVGPRRDMPLQVEGRLHERRSAADVAHRKVEGQPETQRAHVRREELRAEVVGLRNGEARGRPKDDGERREGHPEVAGERREHDVDGERDGCQNHGSDRVRREGVRIEVPVAHPCGNDTSDQDARHQQRGQPERLSLAQAAVCLVRSSPDARVEGAATARGASEANEDGQAVLAQDPEDAHPIHARRARRLAGPLLRCDSLARKRLAVNNVVRKGAGRLPLLAFQGLLHQQKLRGFRELAAAPHREDARHERGEVRHTPTPSRHALFAEEGELDLHRGAGEHESDDRGGQEETRAQGGEAVRRGLREVGH